MRFTFFRNNKNKQFEELVKKELEENLDVIESLRKHDAGEKEISTRNVKRRFHRVQTPS